MQYTLKLVVVIFYLVISGHSLQTVQSSQNYMNTRLIPTVRNGTFDELKSYIENGADVNYQDHEGESALSYATWLRKERMVRYLLDQPGIDVELAVTNGTTPLIFTVQKGHLDIIKILIDHGADIKKTNNRGVNALRQAIDSRHLHVVRYFMENREKLKITEEDIDDMEDRAEERHRTAIVNYLATLPPIESLPTRSQDSNLQRSNQNVTDHVQNIGHETTTHHTQTIGKIITWTLFMGSIIFLLLLSGLQYLKHKDAKKLKRYNQLATIV